MYFINNKIVLLLLLFIAFWGDLAHSYIEENDENYTVVEIEVCDGFCYGFPEDITDNDVYEYEYAQDERGEQYIQDERGEQYIQDERGEQYIQDERGEQYIQDERGEQYIEDEQEEQYIEDEQDQQGEYIEDEQGEQYIQDEQDEQYEQDEQDEYELISVDAKEVYPHLFNITYIKETTQNYEHLRVTLKETPDKGIGIFANRPIKANRVLAYYQMKVYDRAYHKPVSHGMYFFSIINKYEDELSDELVGDLYEESNPKPRGRIPFWGYLSNEPSGNQTDNALASYNIEENYRDKEYLEPGDIIVYKILSTRDIEPGEEITWCYGDTYKRSYKPNCVF